MKKKQWLQSLNGVDDKYVTEAAPTGAAARKRSGKSIRLISILAACLAFVLLAGTFALFIPYPTTPPSVAAYASSPYYSIIQKFNAYHFEPPIFKNTFDFLIHLPSLAWEQVEDLAPGRYMLKMTPEKGYAFTALGKGNVMQTLADGTGLSTVLTLEMGGDIKNAGIGMIEPAKVSGVVFADDNDNGKQDKNEKGLKGVTVRLMSEKGEAAAITLDGSGEFNFNAVLPGKYYLRYELPGDAVFSPVKKNGNAISGENGAGQGEWFTVDVGDTHEAPLCGASLLSNISGKKRQICISFSEQI